MSDTDSSSDILQEQIAYYRARAAEYDEWFYRKGRYDRGEEINRQWYAEADEVRQALHQVATGREPLSHALELAPGTGIWTQELVRLANHVTAVDASEEMIAINKHKLGKAPVTYQQEDLFQWEPTIQYDLVFFGFWLSHVPPDQLDPFLSKVRKALRPGGKAFMVDSRRDITALPQDHVLSEDGIIHTRKLNDGREFQIVKIFYASDELRAAWEQNGFQADVRETDTFFIYAIATAI
jgi:2-polyprenyl-3-methyl-5-hydroxy-6-metoxy-1,4-benzoquinol methylase